MSIDTRDPMTAVDQASWAAMMCADYGDAPDRYPTLDGRGPLDRGTMGAEWIVAELAKVGMTGRPAPQPVDREAPIWIDAEFITPQGAADDMERRDNIATAVESLIRVIAAGAFGWLAATAVIVVMAGGV